MKADLAVRPKPFIPVPMRNVSRASCRPVALVAVIALALICWTGAGRAQDPSGVSGDYNGVITTAGAYDGYTGNAKRIVTDLQVPGAAGEYPLSFTRTANSRANSIGGDPSVFGDCGNWRHSYQWMVNQDIASNTYTVAYPDGRVITFAAPVPMPSGSSPSWDPYFRGPIGTNDQLEVVQGGANLNLHLPDGGIVFFSPFDDGVQGVTAFWRATWIYDPYGATTTLGWNYNSRLRYYYLSTVTEPGGSKLVFHYDNVNYTDSKGNSHYWNVVRSVTSNTLADTNNTAPTQTVSFVYNDDSHGNETPFNVNGSYFLELTGVTYNQENNLAAYYTYTNNDGGGNPLLAACDDPHYAGAMTRIQYSYTSNTGYWGLIQSEMNYQPTGPDQNIYAVSTLNQDNPASVGWARDTRGDATTAGGAAYRTFYYGQSSLNGSATSAKPFQPTTIADFEENSTCIFYNSSGSGNGRGYVKEVIDAAGDATNYVTEPCAGQVLSVTSPDGRVRSTVWGSRDGTTMTNNQQGNNCATPYYIYQTTDGNNQPVNYQRIASGFAQGRVQQISYPDGSTETFAYASFNNGNGTYAKISSSTNRLGASFTYNYGDLSHGGRGRNDLLTSVTRKYTGLNGQAFTETTNYYYDALDRIDGIMDPGGVTDNYFYNGRHQMIQVKHAADNTHADYIYDKYGRQTSVSDEMAHVTSTTYDDYGRPTSVTQLVNAYGFSTRTTTVVYDRRDNSNNVIGAALSHTSAQYSYKLLPTGRADMHVYSANNWLRDDYLGQNAGSVTSPYMSSFLQEKTNIQYNGMGRLTQYTDPHGQNWVKAYDQCGRLSSVSDPLGHATTWSYFPANSTVNGVDCSGWLNSVTVPGPDAVYSTTVTTSYTAYDTNGHPTSITLPNGYTSRTVTATHDALGDLTSQSDGISANAITYRYDELGRPSKTVYPDGVSHEAWTYYPGGMVNTFRNRAGTLCTYSYDNRNRLSTYSWNDGGVTASPTYTYDAASRLTEVNNGSADVTFAFDDSNAVSSEADLIDGTPQRLSTTYTRDADGNVASIQYPCAITPCFHYDAQGRCDYTYQAGSNPYSVYNYDLDRLAGYWLQNGVYTSFYNYQNNGRMNDLWHYHGSSSGTEVTNGNISRRRYGFAPDGRISWTNRVTDLEGDGITHQSGSALENGWGNAYYYYEDGSLGTQYREYAETKGWPSGDSDTADSRVDSSQLGGPASPIKYTYGYLYDGAGNRTQVLQQNGNSYQTIASYTPSNDDQNTNSPWSYVDTNGLNNADATNAGTGWTYHYDAEGRMLSASGPNSGVLGFSYDGLGRVVSQNLNGTGTLFYYAGNQRIEERDFQCNAKYRYFFTAPGNDTLLYREDNSQNLLWYLMDLQGNTTHLLDNKGNTVQQYLYDAYGMPSVYDGAGNPWNSGTDGTDPDNRYLFGGNSAYEWLPGVKLYLCRARCYDPTNGRWLQPDPIGQDGGLNIYAYCGNDPVNGFDPTGLSTMIDGVWTLDQQDIEEAGQVPNEPEVGTSPIDTTSGYDPGNGVSAGGSATASGNSSSGFTSGGSVGSSSPSSGSGGGGGAQNTSAFAPPGSFTSFTNSPAYTGQSGANLGAMPAHSGPPLSGGNSSTQVATMSSSGVWASNSPMANTSFATQGQGAALTPYNNDGHHIPAKSAFTDAENYNAATAPAMSNATMVAQGVYHPAVTGAQQVLYRAYAQTSQPLTWDAIQSIETQALVKGGMNPQTAAVTVSNAISQLKSSGVSGPTRIPWAGN